MSDTIYIQGKSLMEALAEAEQRNLEVRSVSLHPDDHDMLLAAVVKACLDGERVPSGQLKLLKTHAIERGTCRLECYPLVRADIATAIAEFEALKSRGGSSN